MYSYNLLKNEVTVEIPVDQLAVIEETPNQFLTSVLEKYCTVVGICKDFYYVSTYPVVNKRVLISEPNLSLKDIEY